MQGHGGDGEPVAGGDGAVPGTPRFVVRSVQRWWRMDGPHGDAHEVPFDEVLAATREPSDGHVEPILRSAATCPTVPVTTPIAGTVLPIRMFVGTIVAGGVLVENPSGGALVIDRTGLRLLDALVEESTVEELAARSGIAPEVAHPAIARLVGAGKARLGSPAAEEATAPPVRVEVTHDPPHRPTAVAPRLREARAAAEEAVRTAWRLSRKVGWVRARVGAAPPAPPAAPAPSPAPAAVPTPVHAAGRTGAEDRVPVYAPWLEDTPLPLALGLMTGYARSFEDGRLTEHFDIRRPEPAEAVLRSLEQRSGPAVLLCSDYLWTIGASLAFAHRARELCPSVVIVHGGPSCPKYAEDAAAFLREHRGAADILVRGEGEVRLALLLDALASSDMAVTADAVRDVSGLTFVDQRTGEVGRTEDGGRIPDLNVIPSPYLTGEFDSVPREEWGLVIPVETNRGCPYGCTFCDWGQAISSRVRFYDIERVKAEIDQLSRLAGTLYITDANFGMLARDLEIAEHIAELRRRTGGPTAVYFTTAKKSSNRLIEIIDVLSDAGVATDTALSLQTTDEGALDAVRRKNISIAHYVELGRQFRRRGQPPVAELMIGLPGQTLQGYKGDLQFTFDHEFQARTWETRILPNSPMNDPEYRAEWDIRTERAGAEEVIRSTRTFTSDEREMMLGLRRLDILTERIGVLRHVLRYLQWEHDLPALDVVERLMGTLDDAPDRYPLLAWSFVHFKRFPAPPVGWHHLYREAHRWVTDELAVPTSAELDSVFALQELLMPAIGRRLPATILLAHDYPTYYLDATRVLYESADRAAPVRPLATYPPAEFTVEGDPFGLCADGIWFDEAEQLSGSEADADDYYVGSRTTAELMSTLMRPSLRAVGQGLRVIRTDVQPGAPAVAASGSDTRRAEPVRVELRSRTA